MKSIITLLALLFSLAAPSAATAVDRQGAANAAYWESANYCPHHSAGKCMERRSSVVAGIGNGRWTGRAEDWECYWFEPCALNTNQQQIRMSSRWYGCEEFTIGAGGGISNRRGC